MITSKLLSSKKSIRYLKSYLLIQDMIFLILSILLAFRITNNTLEGLFNIEIKSLLLYTIISWFFLTNYYDAYKFLRVERIETILGKTLKIIALHLILNSFLILIINYHEFSRFFLVLFYIIFISYLITFKILFNYFLKKARAKGINNKNVLIVGANSVSQKLITTLQHEVSFGYKIVGYFDEYLNSSFDINYLGDFNSLKTYLNQEDVDEVFVSLKIEDATIISDLIKLCENKLIRIKIIPDFHHYTKTRNVTISYYGETPVLMLRNEPLEKPINRILKKVFDIFFSALVILTIFPWLLPIISILIKLGSGGPVFFVQKRTGENNKTFKCIKFRTMRVNKNSDSLQATKFDVRVTKLGKFMRKTNIDELPQFFNVLMGTMSVVGPRPHMLKHTEQYSELINNYLVRHLAKPGITGWAQVNGYRGETKELIDMKKRVIFDIWYIENWSFLLDLKIIIQTVTNIFKGEKNAY